MKVYIVYKDIDAENPVVDKVFDNERKALDYVINKHYSGPRYRNLGPSMLDDNARGDIEEKELE